MFNLTVICFVANLSVFASTDDTFFLGGGGRGVKAINFHSESSVSEPKSRRGYKYTFSESSLQDLFKN